MDREPLPDIHFGDQPDDPLNVEEIDEDLEAEGDLPEVDDDELLDETPEDVVEILGFDPLDEDDL